MAWTAGEAINCDSLKNVNEGGDIVGYEVDYRLFLYLGGTLQ